jgi:26S proteasome regulatory subunit N1
MFADIVSLVAMVSSEQEDSNESLLYCLKGSRKNLVTWGHEYLRSLAGQIGKEYEARLEKGESVDEINQLVDQIIPEFIDHNEEPEAVDLLLEVERLDSLNKFTTENNFERVCVYLQTCASYSIDTEEMRGSFQTAYDIYRKFKRYPEAMRIAQKMNSMDLIKILMEECKDATTLKQMAFMLGRQSNPYESEDADIQEIISNTKLSEHFKSLARDLDVVEPKHPDSIFKSHLDERRMAGAELDSFKKNLSLTYVNAFVNAGYGKDLLITNSENNEDWVFKNKEDGQTAAAASLGMLLLWDIDEGLAQIDKYLDRSENDIVMGGCMALGLVSSRIVNEHDPVQATLLDKLENTTDQNLKIGALMGLSFTYAGSAKAELLEAISPIILDSSNTTQLQAVAALSIGLIYAGTCDEDAAQSVLQTLLEKEEDDLDNPFMRLFALGLGLLFLG